MFAALLFDLDGTLADTDPLHLHAWQKCLAPEGIAVDEAYYLKHITGRTTPAAVRHVLPRLSDSEVADFAEFKERTFRELAGGMKQVNGLGMILEWARTHDVH